MILAAEKSPDLDRQLADVAVDALATEPRMSQRFRPVRSVHEISRAWHLVYRAYHHAGLIYSNPYLLHTTPAATGEGAMVLIDQPGDDVSGTLTVVEDSPQGLSLDRWFRPELDRLREQGGHLMEVGLFAHAGQLPEPVDESPGSGYPRCGAIPAAQRSAEMGASLFGMLRIAFWYGIHHGVTDFVVAAHPAQARYFSVAFGLLQIGLPRDGDAPRRRPMVLMRVNVEAMLDRGPLPATWRAMLDDPINPDCFASRHTLRPARPHSLAVLAGHIDEYLWFQYPGSRVAN